MQLACNGSPTKTSLGRQGKVDNFRKTLCRSLASLTLIKSSQSPTDSRRDATARRIADVRYQGQWSALPFPSHAGEESKSHSTAIKIKNLSRQKWWPPYRRKASNVRGSQSFMRIAWLTSDHLYRALSQLAGAHAVQRLSGSEISGSRWPEGACSKLNIS